MPGVRAIFAADIHLQAIAPVVRAGEPDWFEAMARPLQELARLAAMHDDAPIIYAGDIFNTWDARPEVINFALANLPPGYAIPGQHDLPNHSYDEIKRSAYWTLVKAGCLTNIPPAGYVVLERAGVVAHGFPWGFPPVPKAYHITGLLDKYFEGMLDVAVVHQFIYTKGTGYPGAPVSATVSARAAGLAGYAVAVYGDNHRGFIHPGAPTIYNCGGFMRRDKSERAARPGVGLLHADGTVTKHHFDTTAEVFAEMSAAEEAVAKVLNMGAFVDGLQGLESDDALDFITALERFIQENDVPPRVVEIMLQASEGAIK